MYFLKKIIHIAKYNFWDKWGFIYLERPLDDTILNIPKIDKTLLIRMAKKNDILKITSDIFPHLTQEEIDHDGKYIKNIIDSNFSCVIAEKDNIIVHYFLFYGKVYNSPLIKTPINKKLIHSNDSFLGGAFTIPCARGLWISQYSLSMILLHLRDSVKSKKVFAIVHKNTPGAEDFFKINGFNVIKDAR